MAVIQPGHQMTVDSHRQAPVSISHPCNLWHVRASKLVSCLCIKPKHSIQTSCRTFAIEDDKAQHLGSRISGSSSSGSNQQIHRHSHHRKAPDKEEVVPRHVAVIMDGNGRWAARRGLPVMSGHEAGGRALLSLIHNCCRLGIKALTVYAFSTENWNRPEAEVNFLMMFFERVLQGHVQELHELGVHISFIGQRHRLPQSLRTIMESAEQLTCDNTGLYLTLALSYSGQEDLTAAARRIAALAAQGLVDPDQVDADMLQNNLSTAVVCKQVGPPDLLIRTSGEQRVSNFLLFEMAYSELYFTDVLWPDFDEQQFVQALKFYSGRQRRFGARV